MIIAGPPSSISMVLCRRLFSLNLIVQLFPSPSVFIMLVVVVLLVAIIPIRYHCAHLYIVVEIAQTIVFVGPGGGPLLNVTVLKFLFSTFLHLNHTLCLNTGRFLWQQSTVSEYLSTL
jgi:hypothetical protein